MPRKMRPASNGSSNGPRLDDGSPSSRTCIPPVHQMERQFIFRADEDLAEALTAACRREERTRSSLIRYALRRYLSNESAQPAEAGRSQNRAMTEPANEA
jgi:hypothetical protein